MRTLRFGSLVAATLSFVVSCTSDKSPDGDIGYGPCAPTSSSTGGSSSNSSAGKSNGSKGGSKTNAGGTDAQPEGGGPDGPLGECEQAWTEQPDTSECDIEALEESGVTIGEESGTYRVVSKNTTLQSGKSYKLNGLTIVQPGVTLTIEKCTKILGQGQTSKLLTASGVKNDSGQYSSAAPGKLIAIGEKNAPIVFTSARPAGERKAGDWGGVLLTGRGSQNEWRGAAGTDAPLIEGIEELQLLYGWKTDEFVAESSGDLEYVRIEYAGHTLSPTYETNGLTLAAVGSGTVLHHIEVSNAKDDCFEWFGGSANAHHLIAFNCDDDAFDTDQGFNGTVQFVFTRQPKATDELDPNGFESDGNKTDPEGIPLTTARFANATVCGAALGEGPVNPRYGAVLRVGTRIALSNVLLTGFDNGALSVRDLTAHTEPTITNSTLFDNFAIFETSDKLNYQKEEWFTMQEGNGTERPATFCDCQANPPLPFPVETIPGGAPGDGFEDPEAAYQGAFKDSKPESNWMTGQWVSWAEH